MIIYGSWCRKLSAQQWWNYTDRRKTEVGHTAAQKEPRVHEAQHPVAQHPVAEHPVAHTAWSSQHAVVAFYHFIASHNISIGCWRTEITFNEFPPFSFKMEFVFICFAVWAAAVQQHQISSGCNYVAAVVQTSTTGPGISNVKWVRHWIVHFERGTSAFVTCSCKGSEINLSIQFEDFDRR